MLSRSFNNIIINGRKVKKVSEHTSKLKNEMIWLDYFENINKIGFVKINENSYKMDLFGQPESYENALSYFRSKFKYKFNVKEELDSYFSKDDYHEMYINKPLNSLKQFSVSNQEYSNQCNYLIKFILNNENELLDLCYENKKIGVIHGDLIYSNILIDSSKTYKYIDPRGSFGKKKGIFGDVEYDDAKFATSKMGYDEVLKNTKIKFKDDIDFESNRIMYKSATCLMSNLIYHNDLKFNERQLEASINLIKRLEGKWNI